MRLLVEYGAGFNKNENLIKVAQDRGFDDIVAFFEKEEERSKAQDFEDEDLKGGREPGQKSRSKKSVSSGNSLFFFRFFLIFFRVKGTRRNARSPR